MKTPACASGSYKPLNKMNPCYRTPPHLHGNNGLGAGGGCRLAAFPPRTCERRNHLQQIRGGWCDSSYGCKARGAFLLDGTSRSALPTDRYVHIRCRIVRDIINVNICSCEIHLHHDDCVPVCCPLPGQTRNSSWYVRRVSFAFREEKATSK